VPPFLAIARATRVTLLITLALDKGEALTVRTRAISCEHWSIAAVWSIRKAVLREIGRLGSYVRLQQVTGPIRRTAALLAGHGFVVVVPEIFHELEEPGTVLPYDQAGADRGNADKINKELSSYDADAKAALSSLKSHPKCTGRIGSMGFCISGHLAFRSATNPEVLAATCCYPTDIHKRSLGKGLNDDTLDRIPESGANSWSCLAGKTRTFPAKARQRFTMHWPTLEQISAGTNSTAPTHSCGTEALDTTRPPHGRSTQWRWICSGASLAKATSRKFKAPPRRAIRRTAYGAPLLSRISVRRTTTLVTFFAPHYPRRPRFLFQPGPRTSVQTSFAVSRYELRSAWVITGFQATQFLHWIP